MDNYFIEPLVKQHCSDAAFYWQTLHNSSLSPLITRSRAAHFQKLMHAHLDGAVAANEWGLKQSLQQLQRFLGQGDAFVAWYCHFAFSSEENDWEKVKTKEEKLRAFSAKLDLQHLPAIVSACRYLHRDTLNLQLKEWWNSSTAWDAALALRVSTASQIELTLSQLDLAFNSPHPLVKASLMRWIGRSGTDLAQINQKLLWSGLHDNAALVREESAIAYCYLQTRQCPPKVAEVLLSAIDQQIQLEKSQKGLNSLNARRRAQKLAVYLAYSVNSTDPFLNLALKKLPLRLQLLVMAHSGATHYVQTILNCLDTQEGVENGSLAMWALHMLTGLPLGDSSLHDDETQDKLTQNKDSIPAMKSAADDAGLPQPKVQLVKKWISENLNSRVTFPVLLGQAFNNGLHEDLLADEHSSQVLAFASVMNFKSLNKDTSYFDVRENIYSCETIAWNPKWF